MPPSAEAKRPPLFEDDLPPIDVSGLGPKPASPAPPPSEVRAVAERNNFPSRAPRRVPRRHRTGRNVQLNIKVRQADLERFQRLCEGQGWVAGEALERALDALESKLGQK